MGICGNFMVKRVVGDANCLFHKLLLLLLLVLLLLLLLLGDESHHTALS
jgi:hypothetical protein